jgi:hypothetical protein
MSQQEPKTANFGETFTPRFYVGESLHAGKKMNADIRSAARC